MTTSEPLAQVIDYPLNVAGEVFPVTALQMGNPNCCLFVKDFDALDWRKIGKAIETHEQFPDRTNVVFVRVVDRKTIELRIWERGVGETEASGSCSCAAAVAAMIKGETERQIEVLMPGGHAKIQWRSDADPGAGGGEVVITGSAEVVYAGDWLAGPS
jgi:diaminopimelate epimerase